MQCFYNHLCDIWNCINIEVTMDLCIYQYVYMNMNRYMYQISVWYCIYMYAPCIHIYM